MTSRKFIEYIVYSHLWISLGAASMIAQVIFLIQGEWKPGFLVGFVFGSTLMLYSMHRLIGLSKLRELKTILDVRYKIIGKSQRQILIFLYLGAVIAITCFFQFKTHTQIFILVPGILSLLYVLPLLSKRRRLRDIGKLKIFLIALVWATVVVLLPHMELTKPFGSSTILLFAEKMLFIFAITLPFDIRDLEVDRKFGTSTIPLAIGIKKTKVLAQSMILVSSLLVAFNAQIYTVELRIILILGYLVIIVLLQLTNDQRKDLFYSFVMDGTIVFQTCLVFLISYFSAVIS